jgi:thiazole synthase
MQVTINGEAKTVDAPISVEALLNEIGLDPRKVAVERNLEIVPRSGYATIELSDGDRIEIVHFIGGGSHGAPATAGETVTTPASGISFDDDRLVIAGRHYQSRLLVGTGKYKDFAETARAIEASGAEIVTVAVRRVNITDPKQPMLVDYVSPKRYTYLPNTAGCFSAADAVRTLRLAREAGGWDLVKLEVLGDQKTLYPNMTETLSAAELLVREGFKVMVYCNDDPIAAKRLEEMGCVAIMPLAAPIGSGLGIQNPVNVRLIVEQSSVPVLVDAGVGTASDATVAMELGCDGVLMNTAIAEAKDPIRMARAMKLAVEAGRLAYLAGRMPKKRYADPSSPLAGLI